MASIDPAAIKELLASTDIAKLEGAVRHLRTMYEKTKAQSENSKSLIQILLWNRIQILAKEASMGCKNRYKILADYGSAWAEMSRLDQLTKAVAFWIPTMLSRWLLGGA
jgi:hypothetical protein